MKLLSWSLAGLAAGCFGGFAAYSQVVLSYNFDTPPDFLFETCQALSGPDAPHMTRTKLDTGTPSHGKVVAFEVDASNQTNQWYAAWVGMLGSAAPTNYDPAHTFLKFDALVNQLRPVHAQIRYCGAGCINIDVDVYPTATNCFQSFLVRLSEFKETLRIGTDIPPYPTAFYIGMRGVAADPAGTWACGTNNVLMIDNIQYILCPPLAVAGTGAGMFISWPTNTAGFVLQCSPAASGAPWTNVTNAPTVADGCNQVFLPHAAGPGFYRLAGP